MAVCCSVLQCVTGCCSVLQCVAVCCSVLQGVAVCCPTHRGLFCAAAYCSQGVALHTEGASPCEIIGETRSYVCVTHLCVCVT